MVNEVAPRPHNSGHYTIEAVPQMSQYKAQLHAVMNIIPKNLKLTPRTSQAIMLNILGGADASSHEKLIELTETAYIEDVDVYLHMYGKASKPGRKIGHITFTTPDATVDLAQTIAPFINEVDRMREQRRSSSAEVLRPVVAAETKKASSKNAEAPLVVVTMGSDSDLGVLAAGLDILEKFEVPYDCTITSAHRTPTRMTELANAAAARGVKAIIAAAGGAAHLPGMLASETTVPVIGVPVKATHLDGKDSLLSIVQMPVSSLFSPYSHTAHSSHIAKPEGYSRGNRRHQQLHQRRPPRHPDPGIALPRVPAEDGGLHEEHEGRGGGQGCQVGGYRIPGVFGKEIDNDLRSDKW